MRRRPQPRLPDPAGGLAEFGYGGDHPIETTDTFEEILTVEGGRVVVEEGPVLADHLEAVYIAVTMNPPGIEPPLELR